jgi:protease II
MKKKNTFNDIITVVEYLIRSGYSSRSRMTAIGTSAGGLALGMAIHGADDGCNNINKTLIINY